MVSKLPAFFCCLSRPRSRDGRIREPHNNHRRRLRPSNPLRRPPRLHSCREKIRPDDDHSRSHSSVPHTTRRTRVTRRPPPLPIRRLRKGEAPPSPANLAPDKTRSGSPPQESSGPATSNRCEWASSNTSGSPRPRHGSSPQNSEKAPSSAFSLPSSEPCQSSPYAPPAAACPPKSASSSNTSRRPSPSAPNSTHDQTNRWNS